MSKKRKSVGKNIRKVKDREREMIKTGRNRKQKRKAKLTFLYLPTGIVYLQGYWLPVELLG
ncbi:hypothetical protein [Alteromonas sp. P256]|uniref:hypothetical protein n=1 Tax=Alteromonas sp. P256 TaxID=3117399 RepID=UPI002FE1373B